MLILIVGTAVFVLCYVPILPLQDFGDPLKQMLLY